MEADLSVGEKILKEVGMPNRLLCYESMSQIHRAVTLAYLLGRADMTLIKSNKKPIIQL